MQQLQQEQNLFTDGLSDLSVGETKEYSFEKHEDIAKFLLEIDELNIESLVAEIKKTRGENELELISRSMLRGEFCLHGPFRIEIGTRIYVPFSAHYESYIDANSWNLKHNPYVGQTDTTFLECYDEKGRKTTELNPKTIRAAKKEISIPQHTLDTQHKSYKVENSKQTLKELLLKDDLWFFDFVFAHLQNSIEKGEILEYYLFGDKFTRASLHQTNGPIKFFDEITGNQRVIKEILMQGNLPPSTDTRNMHSQEFLEDLEHYEQLGYTLTELYLCFKPDYNRPKFVIPYDEEERIDTTIEGRRILYKHDDLRRNSLICIVFNNRKMDFNSTIPSPTLPVSQLPLFNKKLVEGSQILCKDFFKDNHKKIQQTLSYLDSAFQIFSNR